MSSLGPLGPLANFVSQNRFPNETHRNTTTSDDTGNLKFCHQISIFYNIRTLYSKLVYGQYRFFNPIFKKCVY